MLKSVPSLRDAIRNLQPHHSPRRRPAYPSAFRAGDDRQLALCIIAMLLLWLACANQVFGGEKARPVELDTTRVSKEKLRELLVAYNNRFAVIVKASANEIGTQAGDPEIKRRSVIWKMRMIPACQDAVYQTDAKIALLDVWSLTAQMKHYFSSGDGRDAFGENQAIAIAACEALETDVLAICEEIVPRRDLALLRKRLDAWVQKHPLKGNLSRDTTRPTDGIAARKEKDEVLEAILKIPLAPFRVVESIDTGSKAMRDMAVVGGQFAEVTERLPEQTRWQVELMMHDIESRPAIQRALQGVEDFNANTTRLSTLAETLPGEIRTQIESAIETADGKQEGFRQTLKEGRETLSEMEQTLERAERIAGAVERSAGNISEAGRSWEGALKALDDVMGTMNTGSGDTGQVASGESSFDFKDVEKTATQLAVASGELRGLVVEVRSLLEDDSLSARLGDIDRATEMAVSRTTLRARSIADHIAWRVTQVILAFVASLILYRVVSVLLRRWEAKADRRDGAVAPVH